MGSYADHDLNSTVRSSLQVSVHVAVCTCVLVRHALGSISVTLGLQKLTLCSAFYVDSEGQTQAPMLARAAFTNCTVSPAPAGSILICEQILCLCIQITNNSFKS